MAAAVAEPMSMPLLQLLLVATLAASATATSCVPADYGTWKTYTAAVIFKRNHPQSVAAKEAVQSKFCSRFGISPCDVESAGDEALVHIKRDFDIHLPAANVTDVLVWLQQYRYSRVNDAGYDLDIMLYPDSGCPELDTTFAVHVGHKTPFNTNKLAGSTVSTKLGATLAASDDDSEFTACSSDATCYEPYTYNTTCTSDTGVESMHFHFYYVSNNPASVSAANTFINATTKQFGLDTEVCADNSGHEQPHNSSCWLSGPGGSGPIGQPASNDTKIGGSFAYPDYSLFVVRDDFLSVLSWTMVMKNAAYNGLGAVDFLVHPNCGCNYADHVFWGLHATTYIPANRQGVAEEAGWEETTAPDVDPWSVRAPGNAAVEGCGLNGSSTFDSWALHMFYDATNDTSSADQMAFAKGLQQMAAAAKVKLEVGVAQPKAYLDEQSVAPIGEQVVTFSGSVFETVAPWAMVNRPATVATRLVPLSSGGQKCRYTDYVSRAMYGGEHWEINEYPLLQGDFSPVTTKAGPVAVDGAAAPAQEASCAYPPSGYVLYLSAVSDNGYQMYSAGLDSYEAGLTQSFSSAFPKASTCSSKDGVTVEPSYETLCFMGTVLAPYEDDADPMMLSYSAVYVPPSHLTEVVSWFMDNHIAAKVYYDVDLRLVPLTGCASKDYLQSALKTGPDWRLNPSALA